MNLSDSIITTVLIFNINKDLLISYKLKIFKKVNLADSKYKIIGYFKIWKDLIAILKYSLI